MILEGLRAGLMRKKRVSGWLHKMAFHDFSASWPLQGTKCVMNPALQALALLRDEGLIWRANRGQYEIERAEVIDALEDTGWTSELI